MRRTFVYAALLAVAGIAPASAEKLYVPVMGAQAASGRSLATQVWVTNMSADAKPVAARFLRAGGAGETRTFSVERGGNVLDGLAPVGATGLIEIEAKESAVSAWIANGAADDVSEVPVIGDHDAYHGGASPTLEFKESGRTYVGAANLDEKATMCRATLSSANGRDLARIPFGVAAKSLTRIDAAAWTSEKVALATVTCDKTFYPLGMTVSDQGGASASWVKGIGPNGACKQFVELQKNGDVWEGEVTGVFHQATTGNPKGIICMLAPQQLRIGKAEFEWDVTVGPWSKRNPSGVHNLAYFFTNRYRSGVIGNSNAKGPKSYGIKWMQNYGMPIHGSTKADAGIQLQQGKLYHQEYTFDANAKTASLVEKNSDGARLAAAVGKISPGNGQALVLNQYSAAGHSDMVMIGEFGNYLGQHLPEEATIGWVYGNFHVTLHPK